MFAGILILTALLVHVKDLDNPSAEEVTAVQADDAAINEMVRPSVYPEQMMAGATANADRIKTDAGYCRGFIRMIGAIRAPEAISNRISALTVLNLGPSGALLPDNKARDTAPWFKGRSKGLVTSDKEVDISDALIGMVLALDVPGFIAERIRVRAKELAVGQDCLLPSFAAPRKVVGQYSDLLTEALAGSDDNALLVALAIDHGSQSKMVSTDITGPAQPVPHKLKVGGESIDLGDAVPSSLLKDGKPVQKSISFGWRADLYTYAKADDLKTRAIAMGKMPAEDAGKSAAPAVEADAGAEDPELS